MKACSGFDPCAPCGLASQTQQRPGLFLLGRNVCLTALKQSQPYSLEQPEALQVSPNCPPLQLSADLEEQTNLCTH